MKPPPWRPQDLADEMKGVDTRPQFPVVVFRSMADAEFDGDTADAACGIVHTFDGGGIQPVVWPMRLHMHSAECGHG